MASILWTAVWILVLHLILSRVFHTTHTLIETGVLYVGFFFMVGFVKGVWESLGNA